LERKTYSLMPLQLSERLSRSPMVGKQTGEDRRAHAPFFRAVFERGYAIGGLADGSRNVLGLAATKCRAVVPSAGPDRPS